jgi:predicted 3-demethylubiquinone-9 3-methyltransferase (glyoxalase superfamily)
MLWFDNQAEDAAKFYVSVFKNSKVKQITHYAREEFPEKERPGHDGVVWIGWIGIRRLERRTGVPVPPSRLVRDQLPDAGGDRLLLGKLTAGDGKEVECGWLADKYGLSWQVVPAKFFAEWVKDPAGLQRVTHEVWQMKKLHLAKLQKPFAGK